MKLSYRIFLLLSFLLVGGYSDIHAGSLQGSDNHFSLNILQNVNTGSLSTPDNNSVYTIQQAAPGTEKENVFAEETEDEVHQSVSLKKCPVTGNCFSTYYFQLRGALCSHIKPRLPLCEHFPDLASGRYIRLCVIRV